MKQLLSYLILLALFLGGCGRTSPVSGMTLTGTVLPDGEVTAYTLLSAGRQIGLLTMTIQHVTYRERPSYGIELVAKTRDGAQETTDSSLIFVTRDSMVPLTTFRFIKTGSDIAATAANYGDSAVAVSAYAQGDQQQQMLPFGPRTYDADQLTVLGRVIRVQGRQPIDIRIISPMGLPAGAATLDCRLSFIGDDAVRVPAGNFNCTKLLLQFGSQKVTVWYEKTGAHRMVRYRTEDGELEMQLAASQS